MPCELVPSRDAALRAIRLEHEACATEVPRAPAHPCHHHAMSPMFSLVSTKLVSERYPSARAVAEMPFPAHGAAPAHLLRLVERVDAHGDTDGTQFILSDGLSSAPLNAYRDGAIDRFELLAWVERADQATAHAVSQLGRILHAAAAPEDARPWYPGDLCTLGEPLAGHRHFLFAAFASFDVGGGTLDVLRVVPIRDDEHAAVRAIEPADRWTWVQHEEGRDFAGMLRRFAG